MVSYLIKHGRGILFNHRNCCRAIDSKCYLSQIMACYLAQKRGNKIIRDSGFLIEMTYGRRPCGTQTTQDSGSRQMPAGIASCIALKTTCQSLEISCLCHRRFFPVEQFQLPREPNKGSFLASSLLTAHFFKRPATCQLNNLPVNKTTQVQGVHPRSRTAIIINWFFWIYNCFVFPWFKT